LPQGQALEREGRINEAGGKRFSANHGGHVMSKKFKYFY
jgi:hypothetical protein